MCGKVVLSEIVNPHEVLLFVLVVYLDGANVAVQGFGVDLYTVTYVENRHAREYRPERGVVVLAGFLSNCGSFLASPQACNRR